MPENPNAENENGGTQLSSLGLTPELDIFREVTREMHVLYTAMSQHKEANFLNGNPDLWIMHIMKALRVAATHLLDFDTFRKALINTMAIIMMCVIEGDRLFRSVPLPAPGEGFKIEPKN